MLTNLVQWGSSGGKFRFLLGNRFRTSDQKGFVGSTFLPALAICANTEAQRSFSANSASFSADTPFAPIN
jgi:hypothetical protein